MFSQHQSYLFVFPHPDDEVYCCAWMHRLIQEDKEVHAVVVTDGDAGGNGTERIQEMRKSLELIGVSSENIKFLGVREMKVLENFSCIQHDLVQYMEQCHAECIVSVDFEGGHEGHDSVNFLTNLCSRAKGISHYVYPIYHAENGKRVAFSFVDGSKAELTVILNGDEKDLKINVLECHRSQIAHFLGIQKNQPNYFANVFMNELYQPMRKLNYLDRPDYEIGYEHHRNGFKFDDFKKAVAALVSRE